MDHLTNEAIDMIFENDALRDRVIKPIKKKAYPYLLTGLAFNLILLLLLIYIIYKLQNINKHFEI
jgi:hypothetical protein